MKQKTIKKAITLAGLGVHSGLKTSITITPANINAGIIFKHKNEDFPVNINLVSGDKLATSLGKIVMVEHLLAATVGLGITNLTIECQSTELPILDGSSLPYVEAFLQVGLAEQGAEVSPITIKKPLEIKEETKWIKAWPADQLTIEFSVDYPAIGQQAYSYISNPRSFAQDLAPARTFGFAKDLAELHKNGYALGASLDNALGISDQGYMNPTRFDNEPVRHKILDLLGDLALLGRPLNARIKANKSSHRLNHALIRGIINS